MMENLRPIEKRILEMRQLGLSDEEIARRVRKTPERVRMIAEWATLPIRGRGVAQRDDRGLSPRQARILALRARGETYDQIAERFRRSPRYIRQLEGLAHFQKYRELLG